MTRWQPFDWQRLTELQSSVTIHGTVGQILQFYSHGGVPVPLSQRSIAGRCGGRRRAPTYPKRCFGSLSSQENSATPARLSLFSSEGRWTFRSNGMNRDNQRSGAYGRPAAAAAGSPHTTKPTRALIASANAPLSPRHCSCSATALTCSKASQSSRSVAVVRWRARDSKQPLAIAHQHADHSHVVVKFIVNDIWFEQKEPTNFVGSYCVLAISGTP